MKFSRAIKQLREELNLQQTELAGLLNVDVSTVSRWEREKTVPSRSAIRLLLIIARERGASEACIANIKEAANPSKDVVEPQNDLRYTDIDMINQLVNNSVNGVIVISLEDESILYINKTAVRMSGRTIQDAKTMKCYEFLMHRDSQCDFCKKYCTENEDCPKYEFTSPVTGRHYVISNKLVTWQGIRAQIKYITDITELYELQTEVRGKQEALFTPVSVQYDLQLQALAGEKVGIWVSDVRTKEIYYSNAANFHLRDIDECSYIGKHCYDIFNGNICTCDDCWLNKPDSQNGKAVYHQSKSGRTLSITSEKRQWNGRDIRINYMKDVTGEREIKQALIRNQEAMEAACQFAGFWMWIYDMEHDCIYPSKNLQRDYGLPEVLKDFPQSWFDLGFIAPDYVEYHREKVKAIKEGSEKEEFECQVLHKDGSVHWSRIRFNRLKNDPGFAVGTSQIIDDEKILQAKVEMERKKLAGKDKNLMGYVVTNITQDKVLERDEMNKSDIPLTTVGLTLEQAMEQAKTHLPEVEWQRYHGLHDAKKLLRLYQEGTTEMASEGHCIKNDGSVIWVRNVYNLLKDPASGDVLLYEYIYDIHSQKMLEEIMHATTEADYERTASVNIEANQMTVLLEGNSEIEIWDYTECEERFANTLVVEEDRKMFLEKASLENLERELKEKDHFEFVCRTLEADGKVHVKRNVFSYYNRDMKMCLMTRVDITEMMEREEEHKNQLEHALLEAKKTLIEKEKLEKNQEMLYVALFTLVPMVISANLTENSYSMLNYDAFFTKKARRSGIYDELIATGIATVPDEQKEIFRETFKRENVLKAYENGEKSVRLEHQQWGDDGILRWIDTNAIFVPDKNGNIYTITLAQDITGMKEKNLELEEALKVAQTATQAKSEFLSRMSHEIRTPMNAIMGMTAIAQENKSDFIQVSDCLNKIELSSHYLLTLLNDILEMSRIESGKTEIREEDFDFSILMESIRTIVETLAAKNGIRYECINKANLDYFYKGDRMRLQQVMVNIITNAIKFTKPGGRVRFTVECEEKDDDQMVFHFAIADTGIGMSEAFMEKLFKPFTQEDGSNTSKYQGSGLGLAISKNLIELMGGSISVVSFLGVGSTFRIELPLKRMKKSYLYNLVKQVEAEKVPIKEEDLKGRRILIAEDHPMNVMIAKKLLEKKGMVVSVADNGKKAVEMFEAAVPFYYDAILMDIRMPVMDGIEAAKQIRQLSKADSKVVPIIAMTANALEEDRRNTKEAGMNAHLAKPFEPKQLYEMLMAWINPK